MRLKRFVQIYICDYLAVDDYKRLVAQHRPCVIQSATGPQDLRLFDIVKIDAKTPAISQSCSHRLGTVMNSR